MLLCLIGWFVVLHDARAIANYLIERSVEDDRPLTSLQIIKLVYFSHAWMLGLYGVPLIRQAVEAWRYGPMIADLYHGLKSCGGECVTEKMRVPTATFDPQEKDLIDQVYTKYGCLEGIRLSELTHAPGTPWDEVWSRINEDTVISDTLIQNHYAQKARETRESSSG